MSGGASLLLAALLAAGTPATQAGSQAPQEEEQAETGDLSSQEPQGGAGVSPVELIPRLELRQSFVRLDNGASVHDTTTQMDIQFAGRVLLRYEIPVRVLGTPMGQVSGFGDLQLTTIAVLGADPRYVAVALVGTILDTASQPPLGAGKQQLFFGGGAAVKPARFWLVYLLLQEQLSLGGNDARADINQLAARVGNLVFGRGYAWYKLDLDIVGDFEDGVGRFFGTLEVGRLLIGRVGLFVRAGTQLAGPGQIDYSLGAGIRYLFRLGRGSGGK